MTPSDKMTVWAKLKQATRRLLTLSALSVCISTFGLCSSSFAQNAHGIDVDRSTVPLTFDFEGTRLVMFGVTEPGSEVALVIRGPTRNVDVRHKDSLYGLWRNDKTIRFRNVPGFYLIASSRGLKGYVEQNLIDVYSLTIEALGNTFATNYIHTAWRNDADVKHFARALILEKQALGLYREFIGVLRPQPSGLFKLEVDLPAYTPIGDYFAYLFIFKNGNFLGLEQTVIKVKKSDLQSFISKSARDHSFLYAICAVLTALLLGLGVAWLRR